MLPAGVRLVPLTPHADERGVFTELFRTSWGVGVAPIQWIQDDVSVCGDRRDDDDRIDAAQTVDPRRNRGRAALRT